MFDETTYNDLIEAVSDFRSEIRNVRQAIVDASGYERGVYARNQVEDTTALTHLSIDIGTILEDLQAALLHYEVPELNAHLTAIRDNGLKGGAA